MIGRVEHAVGPDDGPDRPDDGHDADFHDDLLVTLLRPGPEALPLPPGAFDRVRRGASRRRRVRAALGGGLLVAAAAAIAVPVFLAGTPAPATVPVTPLAPPATGPHRTQAPPSASTSASPAPTPTPSPVGVGSASASTVPIPVGARSTGYPLRGPTATTATRAAQGASASASLLAPNAVATPR